MILSSWTEFSNKRHLESLMQNICKFCGIKMMVWGPVKWLSENAGACQAWQPELDPWAPQAEGENGLLQVSTMAHGCMYVCTYLHTKDFFNVIFKMTLKTHQLSVAVWNIHFLWVRLGSLINEEFTASWGSKTKNQLLMKSGYEHCCSTGGNLHGTVGREGKLILDEKILEDSYWKVSELKKGWHSDFYREMAKEILQLKM